MSTLTSSSTDTQVRAAYDDNASYEEDASAAKCRAFITACRIRRNRIPITASRGYGSGNQAATWESLDAEIAAARKWLAANPPSSGVGSRTAERYADLSDYRGNA
jgi:hypothetical protein